LHHYKPGGISQYNRQSHITRTLRSGTAADKQTVTAPLYSRVTSNVLNKTN